MKNKFAILSHILPPSDSGQAVMLWRLINDISPKDYILISAKNYNTTTNFAKSSNKLGAKYYYLKPTKKWKLWEKVFLSLPFFRNIFYFWHQVRQKERQIKKIIDKENICVLIACSGEISDIPAAYLATKKSNIRLVIYSFDDYVYQWVGYQRKLAKIIASQVFREANSLIVPNEFLHKEYFRRYHRRSVIVHNPYLALTGNKKLLLFDRRQINIVYTGSVYHAHFDAFLNLISAMQLIKSPVKLHIFTGQSQEELIQKGFLEQFVQFHGNLKQEEVYLIQKQADILFLPLAFECPINEVIKTSAPGKMGEYMISGRPILIHSPKDSYLSWYFKKNKCGIIVDELDPVILAKTIQEISKNKKTVQKIVANAKKCVKRDFSIEQSRTNFIKAINYK
jgi:glycosyltransferase involved in cell wall biosynthesis